jgi:hypothetical protein
VLVSDIALLSAAKAGLFLGSKSGFCWINIPFLKALHLLRDKQTKGHPLTFYKTKGHPLEKRREQRDTHLLFAANKGTPTYFLVDVPRPLAYTACMRPPGAAP